MKKIMFNDDFCLTPTVLSGAKTMTRRVLRDNVPFGNWEETQKHLPYKVGEVVAIAQSYKTIYAEMIKEFVKHNYHIPRKDAAKKFKKVYENCAGWTNKMFVRVDLMPHHIKITDVKVERLQDISDDDIMREGVWQLSYDNGLFYVSQNTGYVPTRAFPSAREAFWFLIDKVSGNDTWESNPWVVAYSFELVD